MRSENGTGWESDKITWKSGIPDKILYVPYNFPYQRDAGIPFPGLNCKKGRRSFFRFSLDPSPRIPGIRAKFKRLHLPFKYTLPFSSHMSNVPTVVLHNQRTLLDFYSKPSKPKPRGRPPNSKPEPKAKVSIDDMDIEDLVSDGNESDDSDYNPK